MTSVRLDTLLLFCLLAALPAGCSSGGGEAPIGGGGGDDEPAPGPDGAALYADAGCGDCHGVDGVSGFAVSIACYPADGLDAYVRMETTPHMGGAQADWTDDDLAAVAEHLAAEACAGQPPASHDVSRNGVMHRALSGDPAESCGACHGADLEGFGTVPSCASCHGDGGALTCTGCHTVAQGERRAIADEFLLASHHVVGAVTDADCQVCHDMSEHMQGSVRLLDVDDGTTVAILMGDPLTTAVEAEKLEPFCLACHDADGANGVAPFSGGAMPAAIDATAWSDGSHHLAERTCLGDGETFGCHGTGHGSTKRMLLGPAGGSATGVTGDPTREEEGFCYSCHRDEGDASTDVETAFGLATHHVIGSHEQGDAIALECTSCHDPHVASPAQPLRDPDQGGTWTGTLQAFCLTCHDGDPPDDVSFPATSTGTGFDKSAFVGTTHASELGDDSCLDCHEPHGSAYRAILQARYVVADSNERTNGDYAACWLCHSSSTVLSGSNAFDEYHQKHVLSEDATCAECHDVHKGYDSGEPGLIDFSYALDSSWWMTLPGSQTLSSAFQVNPTTGVGTCGITCHGESHVGESYGGN